MSYARLGNSADDAQLDRLRERLEHEVSARTGVDFPILADRDGTAWADQWRRRVEEALDADTMLLVVVTGGLFGSVACGDEITRFREREKALGREDLIVAVYYAPAPAMTGRIPRRGGDMAAFLRSRRLADWQGLRSAPVTSRAARAAISQLADRMAKVLVADPVTAPAHVVDASRRSGLTSVRAAIRAAKPGDRILVRPGTYPDALVIDKPLEIIGDGPPGDIVIEVRDAHVVLSRASSGRIANLTLRQAGGEKEWWNGVCVQAGRLDIDGCDISCSSLSCVRIGEGAEGHVRRSTLHDAKSTGVFISAGRGTVEDCEIFAVGVSAVSVSGGDVTVRRNRIHGSNSGGVYMSGESTGTIEDNEVFGNGTTAISITRGATAAVRRNRLHGNGHCGVVADHAAVTVEDNDVFGNTMWGVVVRDGADGTLRRNRINGNGNAAVDVRRGASATIEDNDLSGNPKGAWSIATDCEPAVTRARNEEMTDPVPLPSPPRPR
jgi:F-box protein 11